MQKSLHLRSRKWGCDSAISLPPCTRSIEQPATRSLCATRRIAEDYEKNGCKDIVRQSSGLPCTFRQSRWHLRRGISVGISHSRPFCAIREYVSFCTKCVVS